VLAEGEAPATMSVPVTEFATGNRDSGLDWSLASQLVGTERRLILTLSAYFPSTDVDKLAAVGKLTKLFDSAAEPGVEQPQPIPVAQPAKTGQPASTDHARPLADWDERDSNVLWWMFPVVEPPYVGTPLDDDWPGYHTHWTPIDIPVSAPETAGDVRNMRITSRFDPASMEVIFTAREGGA